MFYQSGVGSEANFKGDPVSGTTLLREWIRDRNISQLIYRYLEALGTAVGKFIVQLALNLSSIRRATASKIRDAYVFLAQNYEDGDEICIFGSVLTPNAPVSMALLFFSDFLGDVFCFSPEHCLLIEMPNPEVLTQPGNYQA